MATLVEVVPTSTAFPPSSGVFEIPKGERSPAGMSARTVIIAKIEIGEFDD
jgi:hypothetical protein